MRASTCTLLLLLVASSAASPLLYLVRRQQPVDRAASTAATTKTQATSTATVSAKAADSTTTSDDNGANGIAITAPDPSAKAPAFTWPLLNPKEDAKFWAVPVIEINNKAKPLNVTWDISGVAMKPDRLVLQWRRGNSRVWNNITDSLGGGSTSFDWVPNVDVGQDYTLQLMDATYGVNVPDGGLVPITSGQIILYRSTVELSVEPPSSSALHLLLSTSSLTFCLLSIAVTMLVTI